MTDKARGSSRDGRARSVPPEPPAKRQAGFDPEAQTARLRARAWRSAGATTVLFLVLTGGIAAAVLMEKAAGDLLSHGRWVTGFVVGTTTPTRGEWTITVDYPVNDVRLRARIPLDAKATYHPGDDIVVIYDGANPTRVRTVGDENKDPRTGLVAIPILLGLTAPLPALRTAGWARRHRAARRTGWHSANVLVAMHTRALTATYQLGDRIDLHTARHNVRDPAQLAETGWQRAWISGDGSAMTVLFPQEKGKRPAILPVRATSPLRPPSMGAARKRRRRKAAAR